MKIVSVKDFFHRWKHDQPTTLPDDYTIHVEIPHLFGARIRELEHVVEELRAKVAELEGKVGK